MPPKRKTWSAMVVDHEGPIKRKPPCKQIQKMEAALKRARHNASLLSSFRSFQEEQRRKKQDEKILEQEADLRCAQKKLQDMKKIEQSVNYYKVRCSVVVASAKRQNDDCKKKHDELLCKQRELELKENEFYMRVRCAEHELEQKRQSMALWADEIEQIHTEMVSELNLNRIELNKLDDAIKTSLGQNAELQKDLQKGAKLLEYYKKRCSDAVSELQSKKYVQAAHSIVDAKEMHESIESTLSTILRYKRSKRRAQILIEGLWSGDLCKGEGRGLLEKMNRSFVKGVFTPRMLVKAADTLPPGSIRGSTIDGLSNIFDKCEKNADVEPMFPSSSAVSRARVALNNYAKDMIGYERLNTEYGEVYVIDHEAAIRLMLRACGLDKLAETESVSMAWTSDGAEFTKDRTHVSIGVKITDYRGKHPVTGEPLSGVNKETGEDEFIAMQSREMCCILVIADAREKKELYTNVFRKYYEDAQKFAKEGFPASDRYGPAMKPFNITFPVDMSTAWKVTLRGGGCKNAEYFCHLCSNTSSRLLEYKVEEQRCNRCIDMNKDKCYHHTICDSIHLQKSSEELDSLLEEYERIHNKSFYAVCANSVIRSEIGMANKEVDPFHVDYKIPSAEEDLTSRISYTRLITRECNLRGLSIVGDVATRQERLKKSIKMEQEIYARSITREWELFPDDNPLIEDVEKMIPCILHLENRIGEKILSMILFKAEELNGHAFTRFYNEVQEFLRTTVLGTGEHPSQYKLPVVSDKDGPKGLAKISGSNTFVRTLMSSSISMTETLIPEAQSALRADLIKSLSAYSEAIKLLTLHRKLTDEEIESFGYHADVFFESWISAFGEQGVTNYIHLIGAGHIYDFLKKHRCLYLYSQQGWEALNSKVNTLFHMSSQRGGNNSGPDGGKSYIFPIVQYIMRHLLWITGEGDKFFDAKEN